MIQLHKCLKWMLILAVVGTAVYSFVPESGHSLSNRILKIGSRGDDVAEVQSRLGYLGYYRGKIDGQYGWRTYQAVKNFQYRFGLELIDGIVGPKTRSMLLRATREWRPGMDRGAAATIGSAHPFSRNDIRLMAHGRSRRSQGENLTGGRWPWPAVILNRLESHLFPNSVSGVIFQPEPLLRSATARCGWSPNDTAYKAVQDAINGWDPSLNAMYYFNPATATSSWIWSRPQIVRIGKHIFCK